VCGPGQDPGLLLSDFRIGLPLVPMQRDPAVPVKYYSLLFQQFTLDSFIYRLGAFANAAFCVDDAVPGDKQFFRCGIERIAHLSRLAWQACQRSYLAVCRNASIGNPLYGPVNLQADWMHCVGINSPRTSSVSSACPIRPVDHPSQRPVHPTGCASRH
jgi:hypothetical protein